MPRAFPRLPPDAIAEASSVASSTPGTPATIKATSFGSIQPKRLVWCHDATGRDGELIQRIINKGRAPKSEDERQLRLALRASSLSQAAYKADASTAHAQTSVWRLFRAAERSEQGDGQRQVCRYYAGVACGPRQFDELLPATTGSDFARRLKTAYLDMAREYAFGDEVRLPPPAFCCVNTVVDSNDRLLARRIPLSRLRSHP